MIIAAFMVTGFSIASVYAVAILRGRRDRYHMLGFLLPFTVAAILTPVQIMVGDWIARFIADNQPVKLAALEGVYHTARGVPLHIGGVAVDGEIRYAIKIPNGLSLLAHANPNAEIMGLNAVPEADRPPVNVVHLSFQAMVGIGMALLALSAWAALSWWRRRRAPQSRWFWRAAALGGPAAAAALEAGWITTEVGRQPWIVFGVMRTADAVNPAPGLWGGLLILVTVYAALTFAAIYVLRRLARDKPVPLAPQELDVARYPVT
jgi:cytochrome d ubiquinol oxidase subunit I